MSKGRIAENLIDQVFGNWLVLGPRSIFKMPGGQSKGHWLCRCVCGKRIFVYSNSLVSGKSKSCGCVTSWKKPLGEAAKRRVYNNYISGSRARQIPFLLTEQEFYSITSKNCFYCGTPPSNVTKSSKNHGQYVYSGLDRVDNTEGYKGSNVVPCCKDCNLAKRELTQIQFLDLVKRICLRQGLVK